MEPHNGGDAAATLTIKNLPTEVHRRLKDRAARQRRSLNAEVVACLEAAVASTQVDTNVLLAQARDCRTAIAGHLTDELIAEMKGAGRP